MFVILELLLAGGLFMFGILATSLVAVGIIVQRVYTLWIGFRLNIEALRDKVLAHVTPATTARPHNFAAATIPCKR